MICDCQVVIVRRRIKGDCGRYAQHAWAQSFTIPVRNVSAVPDLANHLKKMRLKNPLVVSPDLGGKERAKEFAKFYGTDYIALQKQRDRKTGKVQIMTANLDGVKGRDLVLVDDMISTGGSIIKAT